MLRTAVVVTGDVVTVDDITSFLDSVGTNIKIDFSDTDRSKTCRKTKSLILASKKELIAIKQSCLQKFAKKSFRSFREGACDPIQLGGRIPISDN